MHQTTATRVKEDGEEEVTHEEEAATRVSRNSQDDDDDDNNDKHLNHLHHHHMINSNNTNDASSISSKSSRAAAQAAMAAVASVAGGNCCAGCRAPIRDKFIFSVIDLHWHQDCVQCADCSIKLNERCYTFEGKLYCKQDYWRRFGPKCFACAESIAGNEIVQKIKGNRVYHLRCFICSECQKQLKTGEQMHLIDGKRLLCKQDYHQFTHSNGPGPPHTGSGSSAGGGGGGSGGGGSAGDNGPGSTTTAGSNGNGDNGGKSNGFAPAGSTAASEQTFYTLVSRGATAAAERQHPAAAAASTRRPASAAASIEDKRGAAIELGVQLASELAGLSGGEELMDEEYELEEEDELGELAEEDEHDIGDYGARRGDPLNPHAAALDHMSGLLEHDHHFGESVSGQDNNHNHNLENEENHSTARIGFHDGANRQHLKKTSSVKQQQQQQQQSQHTNGANNKRKRRRRQKQLSGGAATTGRGGAKSTLSTAAAATATAGTTTKKLANRNGESILNGLPPSAASILASHPASSTHQQQQQQQAPNSMQQQLHHHQKSVSSSASTASNSSTSSSLGLGRHSSNNNNHLSNAHGQHNHHHHQSQHQNNSSNNNNNNSNSHHHSTDAAPGSHQRGSAGAGGGGGGGHKPTRVRTVLNEKQLQTLRDCYNHNPRPDALMKEQLVDLTGLSSRVIRVWFQNKRCKDKKKSIQFKHEKDGRHLNGLTLMRGVPMVASSPIQYDDHSTVSSTPGLQQQQQSSSMLELGQSGANAVGQQQQQREGVSSPQLLGVGEAQQQRSLYAPAGPVHSPAGGGGGPPLPIDIHAYQPPWKNLIDYAHQQQQQGVTPPDTLGSSGGGAASPRYQQLMSQIHGFNGPSEQQPEVGANSVHELQQRPPPPGHPPPPPFAGNAGVQLGPSYQSNPAGLMRDNHLHHNHLGLALGGQHQRQQHTPQAMGQHLHQFQR